MSIACSWLLFGVFGPSDSRDGGRIVSPTLPVRRPLTLTTPPQVVIFVNFRSQPVLFSASFVHSVRIRHPRCLSSSQHTLSCFLAELPS